MIMVRTVSKHMLASIPLGILALALASPAMAQDSVPEQDEQSGSLDEQSTNEIVVTGSLISRRDTTSSSPISTVSGDDLASNPSPSLDRAIGQLPQFSGAQGAAEVGDSQANVGFTGGQSFSDLRGLGPNRSLVLLDGRRLMSSSPDGAIDLNTIPSALIGSVEVITGGASATYGSDAVAGVVNFRLLNRLDGFELSTKGSITDQGDGATWSISGAFGSSFADDRGRFMMALEYANRNTVDGADRLFFSGIRQLARPPEGYIAAGGFGGPPPTIASVNAILATYAGTTPIAGSGAYNGAIGLNGDGTVFTTLAGTNAVQNYRGLNNGVLGLNISANGRQVQVALGNYFAVQVPLKRYTAFAKFEYDLSEDISLYSQFNYLNSKAVSQNGPASSRGANPLIVPLTSPFVTGNAALQSILASTARPATGNLTVIKLLSEVGNRSVAFDYDVWQAQLGFKGTIPGTSLDWNLHSSYGRSQYLNTLGGDVSIAAMTSVLNGTANFRGQNGDCIGFAYNPFGNAALSPGCREFVTRTHKNTNDQSQTIVEATVQGPLFSLPAGELKFAAGVGHRSTSFDYLPDTSLRLNDSLGFGFSGAAAGEQKVNEVFTELLVPILSDKPFFNEVTANLGYRYSDYNGFGGQQTYKADLIWRPADLIMFRGGYSRAIRAPGLGNLFGPTSVSQLPIGVGPNAGDPCASGSIFRTGAAASQVQALCIAQGVPAALFPTYTLGSPTVAGQDGSNPNLTPEKATTYSFGMVLTPQLNSPWFDRLQLSVDYYNIRLKDAIGTLALTDILPRCFNSDGVSNPSYALNNPFCDRITRNTTTGEIALGRQGQFNFATFTVSGIDAQINWRIALEAFGLSAEAGHLTINSTASYLREYRVAGLLGSPTFNYAGTAGFGGVGGGISHPEWKVNTSLSYGRDGFTTTLNWRHISRQVHSDLLSNPASTSPAIAAYNYLDLNAQFDVAKLFTLGFGVSNLTDKTPPFISAAPLTTDAATYDVIGRTFFASLKAKF
jgi:iron complex outermembrane recepter protein